MVYGNFNSGMNYGMGMNQFANPMNQQMQLFQMLGVMAMMSARTPGGLQAFNKFLGQLFGLNQGQNNQDHVCRHDHGHQRYTGGNNTQRAPTQRQRSSRPNGTMRAGDLQNADNARRARSSNGTPARGNVTLAPAGATQREKFDHYASIVRANGGEVCPNGEATVLGIRGMNRDGSTHDTGSTRRYDDTMVVLRPDGTVQEFAGATHPGQNSSTSSPDVAGRSGGARDGAGDVGMINTGNYRVVANGNHAGSSSYHVRTQGGSGRLDGVRDTNHDGQFSETEKAQSAQRGDQLTGVLFHQGGSTRPSSIGCQTLAPNDYQQFIRAVGGGRASFNYTLVDAYRQ